MLLVNGRSFAFAILLTSPSFTVTKDLDHDLRAISPDFAKFAMIEAVHFTYSHDSAISLLNW